VVSSAGYFDQAHLTRSLSHFVGETPAKLILRQKQLSFLYKTDSLGGSYVPLRVTCSEVASPRHRGIHATDN